MALIGRIGPGTRPPHKMSLSDPSPIAIFPRMRSVNFYEAAEIVGLDKPPKPLDWIARCANSA